MATKICPACNAVLALTVDRCNYCGAVQDDVSVTTLTTRPSLALQAPSTAGWWFSGLALGLLGIVLGAVALGTDSSGPVVAGWIASLSGLVLLLVAAVATGVDLALRMQEHRNRGGGVER